MRTIKSEINKQGGGGKQKIRSRSARWRRRWLRQPFGHKN
jgi:hypothetical protein